MRQEHNPHKKDWHHFQSKTLRQCVMSLHPYMMFNFLI